MVEDAYKVLDVKSDASADEIKRAYFRLIRQHTPDNDPEEFQKIRRAYETLRDSDNSEETALSVKLEIPDHPLGKKMMDQIVGCYRSHDYEYAIKTAQEAIQYFGQCTGYLYYLALAQRNAGYTGNSVSNLKILVKKEPQEKAFCRELALSLQERGFGKKAMDAFEKAYRMGCRDDEFILMYGFCCDERGRPELGVRLLTELVENAGRKTASRPLNYIEAYVGIMAMSMEISDEIFMQSANRFVNYLQQAGTAMEACTEELSELLVTLTAVIISELSDEEKSKWGQFRWKIKVSSGAARQTVRRILAVVRHTLPEEEKMWRNLQEKIDMLSIVSDKEISTALKGAANAVSFMQETDDPAYLRFIKLDSGLCLLEEWPENRGEFQILQERYPEIYSRLEEFIHKLEKTSSPDRLRETMLKDYARLLKYYEGFYYEMYPYRMPGREKVVWDSEQEGSYRRTGKKVGRNDPCPCGSGKKYKNCCGRNV